MIRPDGGPGGNGSSGGGKSTVLVYLSTDDDDDDDDVQIGSNTQVAAANAVDRRRCSGGRFELSPPPTTTAAATDAPVDSGSRETAPGGNDNVENGSDAVPEGKSSADVNEKSNLLSAKSPTGDGDHRDEDHRRLSPTTAAATTSTPGDSSPSCQRSKWVKLRSTVKIACAFSPPNRKKAAPARRDSFLLRLSTRQSGGTYAPGGRDDDDDDDDDGCVDGAGDEDNDPTTSSKSDEKQRRRRRRRRARRRDPANFVINPDETFMFGWLTVVTTAVLYNLWTCIAREAFPEIQRGRFQVVWFTIDAFADAVYLADVFVQLRTGYLERGLIVYDACKLARHYVGKRDFVLDVISLIPLDLVQLRVGVHPLVRFPRFLKAYRLYRFVYMVEMRTVYPNLWRVVNLSHILFLGCHWFAAFYFLISDAEGYVSDWGYPSPNISDVYASVTMKYLRSLHWSTLTLTTIGDLPPPETNWE